jgi:hypothetical protein
MEVINLSVCLSDLPKEKMKVEETTGKKFINLTVATRREKSKSGATHTVYVSRTKEEREAVNAITYVGNGYEVDFAPQVAKPEDVDGLPEAQNFDDLPF